MTPRGRGPLLGLFLIVALATVLRFTGLAWGLRHAFEWDERLFVGSTAQMVRSGDWDQRFYEYPGLFFYMLRAVLSWLPPDALASSQPYLLSRCVVAGFGVLSVILTYWLGSKLISARAGLVAAALLAVSPIEVATAHMVRPDVVLEAFALLALLAFQTDRQERARDALSGLAIGAAAAIKFTGGLLLPAYVISRSLQPGRRLRGLWITAAVATAVFLAATPYLFLYPERFVEGFRTQWEYHYPTTTLRATAHGTSLPFYLQIIMESLGPVGCVFGLIGLWRVGQRPDRWGLLLVWPVVLVATLSSSDVCWPRLALPAFGALSLIAALGFERVAERQPWGACAAVAIGALIPLSTSFAHVRDFSSPGTRDRAVDWIEAHVPEGGRILTSVGTLGLDPSRYRVFHSKNNATDDALMAQTVDAVVWQGDGHGLLAGVSPELTLASSDAKVMGSPLSVYLVPRSILESHVPIVLRGSTLTASSNGSDIGAAVDGRLETHWKSEGSGGSEWVAIDLDHEVRLDRVEFLLGDRPERAGRHIAVSISADGKDWQRIPAAIYHSENPDGSSTFDQAAIQVVVLEPTVARRIRISALSPPRQRWGFAEIRLFEAR